jgi:hypothetical protein
MPADAFACVDCETTGTDPECDVAARRVAAWCLGCAVIAATIALRWREVPAPRPSGPLPDERHYRPPTAAREIAANDTHDGRAQRGA